MQPNATIRGYVELPDPSPEALDYFHAKMKLKNPEYASAKRHSANPLFVRVPQFVRLGRFDEVENVLYLPRGYDLSDFPEGSLPEDLIAEDLRVSVPAKWPEPVKFQPNNMQQEVLRRCRKRPVATEDFLFQAGTGTGKTMGMLELARFRGQRTLVVMHRHSLMVTWRKCLSEFYPHALDVFGELSGNARKEGSVCTLAMVQTLKSMERQGVLEEVLEGYGTVVLDEAHLFPAKSFHVIGEAPAKYRIAATATLRRKDGLQKMVEWTFGPSRVKFKGDTSNSMRISDTRIINTGFAYIPGDEGFKAPELATLLREDRDRNRLILEQVRADVKGHANTVLVTTNSIDHAFELGAVFRDAHLPCVVWTGGWPTRNVREKQMRLACTGVVGIIVATDSLIREGADIPPINRLHVTVPLGSATAFKQLVGRLTRYVEGKPPNIVTVYLDVQTPSLRNRVTGTMFPVLREAGAKSLQNFFMA